MAEVNEVLERNVDPIGAMMTRTKQELAAIDQQITASRTTLRALETTLRDTQMRVSSLQAQLPRVPTSSRSPRLGPPS
jgi:septal ring factor EnvC (AmiA/AmiB activator)